MYEDEELSPTVVPSLEMEVVVARSVNARDVQYAITFTIIMFKAG